MYPQGRGKPSPKKDTMLKSIASKKVSARQQRNIDIANQASIDEAKPGYRPIPIFGNSKKKKSVIPPSPTR